MDIGNTAFEDMPTKRLLLRMSSSPAASCAVPAGMPYKLFADGALIRQGVVDATGQLTINHHVITERYELELANGVKHSIPVSGDYRGDARNGDFANRGFQFHENGAAQDVVAPGDRALHRSRYSALLDTGLGK